MSERLEVSGKNERAEDSEKILGVHIPWVANAKEVYGEHSKEHPERVPYIEAAVRTFFEQELRNLDLYASKEKQAAFPYTVIRVNELARTLYGKYGPPLFHRKEAAGSAAATPENTRQPRKHTEFFFTTALKTYHGNGFAFVERAIHEAMQALPAAMEALREGREPDDVEFYTLGFPTNELGHMSPSFAEKMLNDPFKSLGQLYAEFVENRLVQERNPDVKENLVFSGISMGCNFAAEAAKDLVSKGAVTQSSQIWKEKQIPQLSLQLYSPTGTNESRLSYLQIGAGFLADAAAVLATDPRARNTAFGEKRFFDELKTYVAQRKEGVRMVPYMDAEQKELKEKIAGMRGSIVQTLLRGVPIDPRLKVNKITGVYDPTLFSISRTWEERKQRKKTVERVDEDGTRRQLHSLARHTLKRNKQEHREFAMRSSHNIPFFGSYTKSEMRRWDQVAKKLGEFEKEKKAIVPKGIQ